jgi:hypothetical protein
MKKILPFLCVLSVLCVSFPSAALAQNPALAATTTTRGALVKTGVIRADGTITAAATAGAATLNKTLGTITSEALTTAGLAAYTLTLTDSCITASSIIVWSIDNGTNTQGTLGQGIVTPGSGSAVFKINNLHATQALNGTIKVNFQIVK